MFIFFRMLSLLEMNRFLIQPYGREQAQSGRTRGNRLKLCILAASYRILTCTRALRAQFIITAASTLERKERTTATPEFSDEWLSNCIALMILPMHNDVLEYLN